MPIDPTKPVKILVVHGVEIADDSKLDQDKDIDQLVKSRLGGIALDYEVEMYKYEDIEEAAQKDLRRIAKAIVATPVGQVITDKILDLVLDVVINLKDDSTAATIRAGLMQRILNYYDAGHACFLVAHSLGTIYSFDVVNELMRDKQYFNRNEWMTWPVQGLVTLGSPIGLNMFQTGKRRTVTPMGAGMEWFRWLNYWDRTDPVVSGSIFGKQLSGYQIAERYIKTDPNQGWVIRDRIVDTGKTWLLAHTAYWANSSVGDGIVELIAS
jgi:hypothetical protein